MSVSLQNPTIFNLLSNKTKKILLNDVLKITNEKFIIKILALVMIFLSTDLINNRSSKYKDMDM